MKSIATFFFASLTFAAVAGGNLRASIITLGGLPGGDTDTISIQLAPLNGAVHGLAGTSVGWGFIVNWTSTQGDWISFTGTSMGSVAQGQTNPALLADYSDLIGAQGGPVDFGLSPGTWTEAFDGASQGVGIYRISGDPSVAKPGAVDIGQITFSFQVYNGDPLLASQIGNDSYAYYGQSTAYSVTVDSPAASPEPGSWLLFGGGFSVLYCCSACRARSRRAEA